MSLGGKNIQGISPKQSILNYKDGEQATIRRLLVKSWNTANASGSVNGIKRVITPFRAVNNGGDFLARTNYVCGGPNPAHSTPGGIRSRFGSIISQCDTTGIPAGSANMHYVADSSDYVRFRKQQAMNNNYNDTSFGGYNNSAYSKIMAMRRF